ncbi:MAG: hypothetical protein ACI83D_000703 [Planctomycetota bacterium]|jgi:hypothetical protein
MIRFMLNRVLFVFIKLIIAWIIVALVYSSGSVGLGGKISPCHLSFTQDSVIDNQNSIECLEWQKKLEKRSKALKIGNFTNVVLVWLLITLLMAPRGRSSVTYARKRRFWMYEIGITCMLVLIGSTYAIVMGGELPIIQFWRTLQYVQVFGSYPLL